MRVLQGFVPERVSRGIRLVLPGPLVVGSESVFVIIHKP